MSPASTDVSAAAKGPITISVMLATMMVALDTTIANVALPRMAGSVSASADQIVWVLTSYIVASAVMTPLTGWLSGRIGRKMLFLITIGGFTATSMLCGIATNLGEIVVFRLLQGAFGAALIPLSQATLLDINPPERHGQAMALWGMGTLLGPILGPALGGWLTDNLSWRWVFFINLPVGIIAFLGVMLFIQERKEKDQRPFDFFGFGTLSVFLISFQLVLDRGQTEDWFSSTEVITEAIVSAISLYLFVVHTATSAHPFFDRRLLRDRNFVVSTAFSFCVMLFLFSTLALLPPLLESFMGYPVVTTGIVTMPRGVASFLSMFLVGRLIGRVDMRLLIMVGVLLNALGLWQMTHFSLDMDSTLLVVSGFAQGLGMGFLMIPLTTLAFTTLPTTVRAEGSALFNLVRNMGSAVGISIMQVLLVMNMAKSHAAMTENIRPDNPLLRTLPPALDVNTPAGAAAMDGLITQQAAMVAYIDDFKLLFLLSLLVLPLVFLVRVPKGVKPDIAAAVE